MGGNADRGVIAQLLLEEQVVGEKQLRYAERIRAKLEDPRPLIEVLTELGYASEEQIDAALAKRRADIPLGELLVERGHLRPDELANALDAQAKAPEPRPRLGEILVDRRAISDRELTRVLADHLGFPMLEPSLSELDRGLLSTAPPSWMAQHQFVPVGRQGAKPVVAFADPTDSAHLDAARTVFGEAGIVPAIASRAYIRQVLDKLESAPGRARTGDLEQSAIVSIVNEILDEAVEREASDIHIEPMVDRLRVRFREDGVLIPFREYPLDLAPSISGRIKILAKADIAERRRHQDGRFHHTSAGRELDLRVSFYITVHGEKIVLRLLNRDRQLVTLDEIGMAPRIIERFVEEALERPSGVILVTGPTGSGKTSTLYSCVNHINRPETSIITAEDPVEYMMDGISQCSLNPAIDLTYEETLRHIVRQDPDVIVIGEIRDAFSAETAIQAALTGHKVLTTFHTEDTIGGLLRLLNMEIEAFLVSSTVVSVLAQRLLRRVCTSCASDFVPTPGDLRRLGYSQKDIAGAEFKIGRGCDRCHQTGYKGRVAIFELLVLDEPVRDAVLNRATSHEIRRISRESSGLLSLFEDGIVKAARGITSIQEVQRMLPRLDHPRPVHELRRALGEQA